MERGSLLCYKIAYCLGATRKWLAKQYPLISRAAADIDYFRGLPTVKQYRSLHVVYFRVLRELPSLLDSSEWKQRLEQFLWDEGLFAVEDLGVTWSDDLIELLSSFCEKANAILSRVYAELEPALEEDVVIKILSHYNYCEQYFWTSSFLLKRLSWEMGFLFNNPVLNLDIAELLRRDRNFCNRLQILLCGKRVRVTSDQSELYFHLEELIESRFIHLNELKEFGNLCILDKCADVGEMLDANGIPYTVVTLQRWREMNNGIHWLYVRCSEQLGFSQLVSSCAVEDHNLVLGLPLSTEHYRAVIRGSYPNIFLLSKDK